MWKTRLRYWIKRHVLRQDVTGSWCLNFFPLSESPEIVFVYTHSGLGHVKEMASRIPPDRECHFLVAFLWHMNVIRIEAFRSQLKSLLREYPGAHVEVLCSSEEEWEAFRRRIPWLRAHFFNFAALLDERIFDIDAGKEKIHNAVVNSRMRPYKRLELASEVENLLVITCGWNALDRQYFERIRQLLAHAEWPNLDSQNRYTSLPSTEVAAAVNRARVGLILSRTEGVCFASAEFLLCGLPVVSTRSQGGREVFYTDDTARIVESHPTAVRRGVEELLRREIQPRQVRTTTLRIFKEHRSRLVDVVNAIYRDRGEEGDFGEEWDDRFENKLMRPSSVDEFDSFIRR